MCSPYVLNIAKQIEFSRMLVRWANESINRYKIPLNKEGSSLRRRRWQQSGEHQVVMDQDELDKCCEELSAKRQTTVGGKLQQILSRAGSHDQGGKYFNWESHHPYPDLGRNGRKGSEKPPGPLPMLQSKQLISVCFLLLRYLRCSFEETTLGKTN